MARAASSAGQAKPLPAKKIPAKWRKILLALPGYDAIATAGDAVFDPEAAQLALDFFPECLQHVEGALAGKPFTLEPWQQAIVANLFGWKIRDAAGDMVRRYKELLLYVPRKNGKTPFAAGLALFVLFCDPELGQQNYVAAADRAQAGMLFRQAQGMVTQEPALAEQCKIFGGRGEAGQTRSIVLNRDHSFLRIISADADTKHGGNPHLVLIDELHAQPNRDLVDVLTTSMASANRKNSLFIYITTADYDRPSICNEVHARARDVRDGKREDRRFLPVIYELEKDEAWDTPKAWAKANPNLGVSVSLDYLEREVARAKQEATYEPTLRRLHMNQKVDQIIERWLKDELWSKGSGLVDRAALARARCWGGLDLANRYDVNAFVLTFREPAPKPVYRWLPFFWIPAEIARQKEKEDKVPWLTWERQGHVIFTEGDIADHQAIQTFIQETIFPEFFLEEIGYDPWNATQMAVNLQGFGIKVAEFRQTTYHFNEACVECEKLLAEGRLLHGSNPVLTWMASCTALKKDNDNRVRPIKPERSTGKRIDGIVAGLMGLGRALATPIEDDDSLMVIV